MDTSEQYIKMCDCSEIQKYRKGQKDFQIGDSIANYILGKYSKANFQGVIIFEQFDEIRDRQLAVWLPRQDQIQEMCGFKDLNHALSSIYGFYVDRMGKFADRTWEQLWLAFYIYEKHKNIWNGNKWINK